MPEFSAQRVVPDKLACIVTFGCQMNEYDSERLHRILAEMGYGKTERPESADLIFLNTCSIRDKAEQKVYSLLGRLRPLKDKNPELLLAVGGCVAQQQGEKILSRAPYVDIVVGTHGIHRLPEMVSEVEHTGRTVCRTTFDYILPQAPTLGPRERPITAFVTIMQGCDNFCSYCIVPYVRGRETSRPLDDILAEVRELVSHGAAEITLLGQNVNSYGRGLTPEIGFVDLLRNLAELENLKRLRFTTSHPKDLSAELMGAFRDIEPLAEHIHLPVQSGSTAVLQAMRRGYSREDYLEKIRGLREACPSIAITTDMIVGFPGESEADFQETMSLVEQVRFDGMYSFKYSDRPGTRASKMGGGLDEETKGRRLADLQARQKDITIDRNLALVGHVEEVLVEGASGRRDGQLTGRTRSNKIVNFDGSVELVGKLVQVRIVEASANSLKGDLV